MKKITMSDEAYAEFIDFLTSNNINERSIRINYAGISCHGPAFNIDVDQAKEDDIVENINDLTFLVEPKLIEDFGGFMFLSSDENNEQGLTLKPLITPILEDDECGGSCCSSCGGGCC